MGRPPIPIDKKTFENLCKLQCTKEEIASVFECCDDTINNWCKSEYGEVFSVIYKRFGGMGKMSLRRLQFKLAKKSASMAIFLGKQYLGQTDKVEQTFNEIENLAPLAELLKDDSPATDEE